MMPGLLGDGFDDPRSAAMMGLAQGLLGGNLGQGLGLAQQGYHGMQDGLLKRQLTKAQLDNYASEIEARKLAGVKDARQQALIASFMGGGNAADPIGGSPGAGAFQIPADGMGPALPQPMPQAQGGGQDVLALSRKLGIPPQAIQADMIFNGGKKISEMLDKHGSRDMQVTNGYAYDKNNVGAGFMPSLSTSQNGQTSMTRIGADGLPVVSAPQGAVQTFDAYNRASAAVKPIKVYNPETQREEYSNEAAVTAPPLRTSPPNLSRAGAGDGDRYAILTQELAKARASGNTEDVRALQNEIFRLPAGARTAPSASGLAVAGGAFAAGPSRDEVLQGEINKVKTVDQAKADLMPTAQRQSAIDSNRTMLATLDKALTHPGLSAGTGLQGSIDPRNYIPGTDAKNFGVLLDQIKGKTFLEAFQALKGAGQITEVEGTKATNAIARLNTAQSTPEYITSLQDLRDVVKSAGARIPGTQAQPQADTKPTARPAAPQGAMNMLKMNPNLRDQFDAKYGEGASARVLGR